MATSSAIERRMQAIAARARALSPRQLLLAGWLGFMVYAFPGYMSFDSVYQLGEARIGEFSDGHPPAMAELWRLVDSVIAGPIGMLVIQSVCFLAGIYFLMSRVMSARAAAITASLVLWFPPIAAVMAVIWKDSQMAGFLMLGTGLLVSDKRRSRLLGLVALFAATAMRYNALVMTGPLVLICFVWNPAHRFWKRYAIAFAAWLAITAAAQLLSGALTDERRYLWNTSLALCDIAATLRYTTPTIPDDELRADFAGIRVIPRHDLHAFARGGGDADADYDYIRGLWETAYELLGVPLNQAERDAVTRAWKKIVFSHLGPYLEYRWQVFRRLLGLGDEPDASPVYNWFTDIQDWHTTAMIVRHDASASRIQDVMRTVIHEVGATPMFSVMLYAALSLILLPFSFRDRRVFALVASAIASDAVLFLLAPTSDWRYSFWLIAATTVALIMLLVQRAGDRHRASGRRFEPIDVAEHVGDVELAR